MVDHNQLSAISYEMSMLVQSFRDNKVLLGHNRWRCECNAEITNRVRLLFISNRRVIVSHFKLSVLFIDNIEVINIGIDTVSTAIAIEPVKRAHSDIVDNFYAS